MSLKNKIALDEPFQKIDFIFYSPINLATVNNKISNIFINLPREYANICAQKSYILLEFAVFQNDNSRYADHDKIS